MLKATDVCSTADNYIKETIDYSNVKGDILVFTYGPFTKDEAENLIKDTVLQTKYDKYETKNYSLDIVKEKQGTYLSNRHYYTKESKWLAPIRNWNIQTQIQGQAILHSISPSPVQVKCNIPGCCNKST